MTFIASVVAKKGVAIIADSLVTSEMPILHYQKFINYIDSQPKNEEGETLINPNNIRELFSHQPIFTKDYEEKLFELNEYTAITITGSAYINEKNISDLIEEFKGRQQDIIDMAIAIEIKIEQLKQFLIPQIKESIEKNGYILQTIFVITYYEKHTHNTHIHRMTVNESALTSLVDADYNFITLYKEEDWIKAVCHGQNRISDKILYGFGREFFLQFEAILTEILKHCPLKEEINQEDFIQKLKLDPYFYDIFFSDIELQSLTDLSVQQAVDLASLLMRIEVDFQKYTKNVPTVGGVIKLAVIDEKGFRFISGDKIVPPKHINI